MHIPKVAILLADGFEEAEVVIIFDVLCRVKIEVELLSCKDDLNVMSYHHIEMKAHAQFKDKATTTYDAIVIPGGPDATLYLGNHAEVIKFIKRHDDEKKWICPICSAAVKVLGKNKLLRGRNYVCSGDLYEMTNDGTYFDHDIVVDGNLFSGRGLGVAFNFAFNLAEILNLDPAKVRSKAEHIYIRY